MPTTKEEEYEEYEQLVGKAVAGQKYKEGGWMYLVKWKYTE